MEYIKIASVQLHNSSFLSSITTRNGCRFLIRRRVPHDQFQCSFVPTGAHLPENHRNHFWRVHQTDMTPCFLSATGAHGNEGALPPSPVGHRFSASWWLASTSLQSAEVGPPSADKEKWVLFENSGDSRVCNEFLHLIAQIMRN